MQTKREIILMDLKRCIDVINSFNHKNFIQFTINQAIKRYSIKGLSLQHLKPFLVLKFIKRIQQTVQTMEDTELQTFLAFPQDQWSHSEKKIFVWICICYAQYKSKTIKFFNQNEDLQFIRHIFYRKSQDFIHFNLMRITSQNKISDKWTAETEELLVEIIRSKSESSYSWSDISFEMFILSQRKSFFEPHHCRQRWINHLDPSVLKQKWTQQEDRNLIIKVITLGKKWAFISSSVFKGSRTQHMIKNRYNSIVRKYTRKGSRVNFQKIFINLCGDEVKQQQQNTPSYKVKQQNIMLQIQNNHHNAEIRYEPNINNNDNASIKQQNDSKYNYFVLGNNEMHQHYFLSMPFQPNKLIQNIVKNENQTKNQILN